MYLFTYILLFWRRKWQRTPVFLPGKFLGQRSLVGYSLWGCKRVGHNLVTKHVIILYIYIHMPHDYFINVSNIYLYVYMYLYDILST